jgi:hypothetical protein
MNVAHEWELRQPLLNRMSAVLLAVVSAVGLGVVLDRGDALGVALVGGICVLAGVGAVWQCSSYRVWLSKDDRGRLLLHKRRFLFAIPLGSITVPLTDYDVVRSDFTGGSRSLLNRLLTGDRRGDGYILELYRRRDGAAHKVYRGPDEAAMHSLADALREHANLPLTRK